jgi:hypothetical protein
MRRPQAALVRMLRGYFERAPAWVLLTTRGRKSGLPREVLLPCERWPDGVQVTCGGWVLSGRAEIVEDLESKRALVRAHPFFPPAPFAVVHIVLRTLLRPVLVWLLSGWVAPRPVVLIRPETPAAAASS